MEDIPSRMAPSVLIISCLILEKELTEEGTCKVDPFVITQEEKKIYSLPLPNTLSDHYGIVATLMSR